MKILDKVKINDEEYTCIQVLYIDNRRIYKVFNAKTKESKFIGEGNVIKDKRTLEIIDRLTNPKTDVIEKIDFLEK